MVRQREELEYEEKGNICERSVCIDVDIFVCATHASSC